MTIALLVSVSLFALVVAGRPIGSVTDFISASSALQPSVQTAFRILGKDDLASDATRFHSQRQKQQTEHFLELGTTADSLEISSQVQPLFDAFVEETAVFDPNDELGRGDAPSSEPVLDERYQVPTEESPSAPFVVLAFSCIAAFLALACIALTLYIIKSLRSQVLASKTAWGLLPRFRRYPGSQGSMGTTTKSCLSGESCLLLQTENLLDTEKGSARLLPGDKYPNFDAASDMESEWDDVDEKYEDALDMTPLPLIHDLPAEDNVSCPSHFDDPLVLSHPPDPPTTDRSATPMRELCPSAVARPAWSLRAIDSPALGLPSRQSDVDATSQPFVQPRRRAYRSPVPEFDIALAMQLRPGLGLGADSAWMVRFLMAIFGWFAVALTGNAR